MQGRVWRKVSDPVIFFKYRLHKYHHIPPITDTQFSSVQSLSHVRLCATPWTAAPRLPCPSPTARVYSDSCPLSRWCHPTISSSVVPFSSCLKPFPASGSFQMSQLFASGGQSIGVSASTLVLPINIQDWFPLGWTSWISLKSKGLSRVFSNTTVQKHQFFGARSVQFSSVSQSCPTLCDPMIGSTPGLPVCHQLLEFTRMYLIWFSILIAPPPTSF